MKYRHLGRSGVKVSEVALGGWLTHGRSIDDDTTSQIVHRAFDLGVNFFDTADIYNKGEAEKALAKAIKDLRREDLFIATKCFWPMSDAPNDQGLSRKHIVESVNASLKRLEVDYIDLFQFHRFDKHTPVEESVRAMDDLIRQGKVLYWGTSEWPAEQIMHAHHLSKQVNCCAPVSNQPLYNMFDRYIEKAVLPTCEITGMSQVCFSPLAQGVLTGKYKPGAEAPEGSRGADEKSNKWMSHMDDESLERVQQLAKLAEENGCTVSQLALAWCLRQPGVASVIVGATKNKHIEENAAASDLELDAQVWERVEEILP